MSLTSSAIIHKRTKEQWTVFWTSFCSRCLRCTTRSSQSTIPTWTRCGVHCIDQNIARIVNGVQVTLWLSVTQPQCRDLILSSVLSGKVNCVTKSLNYSLCLCLSCWFCNVYSSFWSTVRKESCFYNSSAVNNWVSEWMGGKVTNWAVLDSLKGNGIILVMFHTEWHYQTPTHVYF